MIRSNIPNLFTLSNLLCGCIAIVFAFQGNLVWSAYMVGIACVLDFLDGMMARWLNVHSEMGKQLDSLADVVSFGVVPGVILFRLINRSCITCAADLYVSVPISFIGFIVTIFSAVRLAKFNIDTRQSDSFLGVPTPANAIFISSLALILELESGSEAIRQFIGHPYFLISLSFISSIGLVSPLQLFALKFKNFTWTDNMVRYIFLVLASALLIIFKAAGVSLIIVLYIILSVINNLRK